MKTALALLTASTLLAVAGCASSENRGAARTDPWPGGGTSTLDYDPYGSTRQPAPGELYREEIRRQPYGNMSSIPD